ncbi:HPr family phosphocarrier protein, partial [Pseudoalteromonas sp. Q18-MNA-CIBAN-0097]
MASKTVKVGSSVGLHARPAAVISQEAAKLSSTVTLATEGGEPIDAKSVLLIMT